MNRFIVTTSLYKNHLQSFSLNLWQSGYSPGMQKMMTRALSEFFCWMEQKEIFDLPRADAGIIMDYYTYLGERPNQNTYGSLSTKMISSYMYGIKSFFIYLQQCGDLEQNPFGSLFFPRPESKPRQVLTRSEIQSLYDATQTLRDRAMLGLHYGCGLRSCEAESLNTGEIRFKSFILYVREGKGKKRREVPIGESVCHDLKDYYYNERSNYITRQTPKDAFLLNDAGGRMLARSNRQRLKKLLVKAGITKNLSLHSLRHSIATHLLENGMSISYIREFLGHQFLETTQIYTKVKSSGL